MDNPSQAQIARVRDCLPPPETPAEAGRSTALLALAERMAAGGTAADAPVRQTMVRVGDRWSSLLLFTLATGRYRHAELRRVVDALSGIGAQGHVSQRMLTLHLRGLERDGLVVREVGGGKLPPVSYALTPLGEGLARQLDALTDWCVSNRERMCAAQQAFDARGQQAKARRGTVHRAR